MFLCLKKELDRLFLVHAVTCLFIARVVECQQTGDDVSVLKALGDHGDRIADLENIVKQLKSDYKNSLLELYELRTENIKLREEIEVSMESIMLSGEGAKYISVTHCSFPAYFCLSPLQKHVRKIVGGFGKKSCDSTGVRKQGTHMRHRPPLCDLSC